MRLTIVLLLAAMLISLAEVASATGTLTGKVTAGGVAFQGAIVGAKPAASGGYALADAKYYAVTDANGDYTISVDAGDYLVAAWPHCDTPTDPFTELWVMSDNAARSVGEGGTQTADFDITESLGENVAKTTDGTKVLDFRYNTTDPPYGGASRMNMFNGNRGRDGATWFVPQGAWVRRDLGANPPAVGSMVYATDPRRATGFTIAYSNDDITYTPAFSTTSSSGYQYVNAYGTWYWTMIKLPAPVIARYWKVTIDTSPGNQATSELELYKVVPVIPNTIKGKVTVNGTAFQGAIVGAKLAASGGYALADADYYAVTDANGDYSLDVAVGDYLVAAWPHCETPYPFEELWAMSDNVARTVGEGETVTADFNITESIGTNYAQTSDGDKVFDSRYVAFPPNGHPSRMNAFNGQRRGATWYVPSPVGQWLKRDLGEDPPSVTSMVYATDNRRATAFTIAYSNDDLTYTTAFSTVDTNGGYHYVYESESYYWEMVKLSAPVAARYWRITIDASLGDEALAEFELYGPTTAYTGNNISDLKGLDDGKVVAGLTGKICSGVGTGIPAGVFYIEEADRHAGVRVAWDGALPAIGDTIAVGGTKETTPGGETYIAATAVTADPGTPVNPLAANTRSLADRLMDGLLIKTAGTVKTVGMTSYTIVDGYYIGGVEVETTVETLGFVFLSPGMFVTVTGVASYDGGRIILAQ